MIHCVYLTTNTIDGKQYVGDHSTENMYDNYLGSGLYLKRAIKQYGRENFKREILEFFETKEKAFNAQEKYINEYNTLSPNGYNISPKGGHNVKGCISEETKQKIRQTELGKIMSEEAKQKISRANSGKNNPMYKMGYKISGEKNGNYGKPSPLKGVPRSEETKKKIGEKQLGNKRSAEVGIKIRKKLLGTKQSDETKQKRSESLKASWRLRKNKI